MSDLADILFPVSAYSWLLVSIGSATFCGVAAGQLDHFVETERSRVWWKRLFVVGLVVSAFTAFGSARAGQTEADEAEAKSDERAAASERHAAEQAKHAEESKKNQLDALAELDTAKRERAEMGEKLNTVLAVVRQNHPNATDDEAVRLATAELQKLRVRTDVIDERTKARHLTPVQRAKIVEIARSKTPRSFTLVANVTVPDAFEYTTEIAAAFKEAGWSVNVARLTPAGGMAAGFGIAFSQGQTTEANDIAEVLVRAGVGPVAGDPDPAGSRRPAVLVSIGAKPEIASP